MLTERTIWTGRHRDINFELNKFPSVMSDQKHSWTHYIYVWDIMFPEEVREQLKTKVYYTSFGSRIEAEPDRGPLYDVEFHGGCTYYQVHRVTEYGTLYKIGCDYQHYWDMGKNYSLAYVEREAKKTIDSLREHFPMLKTFEECYEEFRSKFPGKEHEGFGYFDVNGKELKE